MLPLRENVCIFLLDRSGRVLVARDRNAEPFWRLPQGGIDGQAIEQAALRELHEELGIHRRNVEVIKRLSSVIEYEFQTIHPGISDSFRGQQQCFIVAIFTGDDTEILASENCVPSEFNEWRWAELTELEYITEPKRFKRYEDALQEIIAENLTARVASYGKVVSNG